MFLFNIIVFGFKKKTKLKNTRFWSKGGLQQNGFFMNLCFAKCEKLSFFGGPFFGQILVDVQKHYKNRYFSTLKKGKKLEKMTIFKVNNWAKLKSIIGPSWGSKKKGQLGPIIDFENLRALFFCFQKFTETPIFIGFFFYITC